MLLNTDCMQAAGTESKTEVILVHRSSKKKEEGKKKHQNQIKRGKKKKYMKGTSNKFWLSATMRFPKRTETSDQTAVKLTWYRYTITTCHILELLGFALKQSRWWKNNTQAKQSEVTLVWWTTCWKKVLMALEQDPQGSLFFTLLIHYLRKTLCEFHAKVKSIIHLFSIRSMWMISLSAAANV